MAVRGVSSDMDSKQKMTPSGFAGQRAAKVRPQKKEQITSLLFSLAIGGGSLHHQLLVNGSLVVGAHDFHEVQAELRPRNTQSKFFLALAFALGPDRLSHAVNNEHGIHFDVFDFDRSQAMDSVKMRADIGVKLSQRAQHRLVHAPRPGAVLRTGGFEPGTLRTGIGTHTSLYHRAANQALGSRCNTPNRSTGDGVGTAPTAGAE